MEIGDQQTRLLMPTHRRSAALASIAFHAAFIAGAVSIATLPPLPTIGEPNAYAMNKEPTVLPLVFVQPASRLPDRSGGGGGGNRQAGPIRRAAGGGTDTATLRVATPVSTRGSNEDAERLPAVLLDARSLASPGAPQIGLPSEGVPFGTSTGSGSGGGVGEGTGTGIGSGRGPGVGSGTGGGTGGGIYRVGGSVTPPKVIVEVKPVYTSEALLQRIQGSVVLELVVGADGLPTAVRVLDSLDPGLDARAIQAVSQWRFEPGRLSGRPVPVAVTIVLDFRIW